ncbi:MAG: hypothetical protein EZS28_019318, partial [Streblomastix strix]
MNIIDIEEWKKNDYSTIKQADDYLLQELTKASQNSECRLVSIDIEGEAVEGIILRANFKFDWDLYMIGDEDEDEQVDEKEKRKKIKNMDLKGYYKSFGGIL